MNITEEDALIQHILTGMMSDGSSIGRGGKIDAILARYVADEVLPELCRRFVIGISKGARNAGLTPAPCLMPI
ncbi:hypothetical protein ACRAWG_30250 [Methylobacterium sp. P31]